MNGQRRDAMHSPGGGGGFATELDHVGLSSISPSTGAEGNLPITITATGVGFNPSTVARVAGGAVATTYVSSTSVTFAIPLGSTVGAIVVQVGNGSHASPSNTFTLSS